MKLTWFGRASKRRKFEEENYGKGMTERERNIRTQELLCYAMRELVDKGMIKSTTEGETVSHHTLYEDR